MRKNQKPSLWLVGASPMAQEYAKVLKSMNFNFKVIGRGKVSASNFESATEIPVLIGGLEKTLQKNAPPEAAIVAVGVDNLNSVAIQLLKAGTKRILLEKPGGLNLMEIESLNFEAHSKKAKVLLGYNRRFYESIHQARKIIKEDGGITSCHFEFTEWSHKISNISGKEEIKLVWLFANSSHVIDLAFHLCGTPKDWNCWRSGNLDWHPSGSRFSGAGITNEGINFSYFADWEAPGRWGIEILTKRNRIILRPLEELKITTNQSTEIQNLKLNYKFDHRFKPGIYRQTEAFLNENYNLFCTLNQQVEMTKIYSEIAGYNK